MNKNIKKTRRTYTIEDKIAVIQFKHENIHVTQSYLSSKFNMPIGTINYILKHKEEISKLSSNPKKKNLVIHNKFESIEGYLFDQFNIKRAKNHIITNDLLKEAAISISKKLNLTEFKAPNSWIINFKKIKYFTGSDTR